MTTFQPRSFYRVASVAIALMTTMAAQSSAQASNHIWTGGSGGLYGTSANWNSGVGGAPGNLDTLTFNGGTATTCNITASATVAGITVTGNATLAITAGKVLTVTGNYTQTSNTPVVTVSGGILQVTGGFNQSVGSFTQSSGTLLLDATGAQNLVTNTASFSNLAINDGLAAYWKLDDGGTTVADSSGWGHSGTLFNTPTWTGSGGVPALNFTDSNAMILTSASSEYGQVTRTTELEPAKITVALWAMRSGTQIQYAQMVTKRYLNAFPWISYDLHLKHNGSDDGLVNWEIADGTNQSEVSSAAGALPDGVWTHIAATYDPTAASLQQKIYINGVLSGTGTFTNALGYDTTSTGDLYLGQAGRGNQYFNGALDEIRIYKRALSAAEIYSLYIGNQPGTASAVQTLTGTPTVSNDLILASGTLLVSSGDLTVSGSWKNYGGLFSPGSSTVTLNAASGEVIRSAGQPFKNLTLNHSSTTWTLVDWLKVDGSLTMTNGALSPGSYAIHVSDLNKTSGTFTAGTGKVVIDTTGPVTQSTGFTFNNLRVETPNETNLVGYWKLDEGQGPTTRDATGSVNVGTMSGGANWIASVLPPTTFDNHAAASLNGTSAYVSLGNPAALNYNGPITIAAWVKYPSLPGSGDTDIVAHGYTGSSEVFLRVNSDLNRYEAGSWSGGSACTAFMAIPGGDSGGWVHLAGTSDGTTWQVYRNGVAGNSCTNVVGNVTVTANWAIGARGDGTSRWFGGQVDDVRIYNVGLTATQVAALYAGGYAGTGSGATVTLGANLTVNNTLAIDNGTLNTSTFTVNAAATDPTKTALVNAGTLQVGSNTVTFNGGLTVGAQGTVTENTAGGAIALATGEALEYDEPSGAAVGFPTAAFDWNSFTFWRQYVTYSSYVGATTADTVLALTADGGRKYSWQLPSSSGSLLGTPRWNTEGTMPAVHYIYLITTLGYVYKVLDDGTALTTVSGWPYHNGSSATASSPLANDSTNLYWSGKDGGGTNSQIFGLKMSDQTLKTLSVSSALSAAPALATVSGTNYVFFPIGSQAYQVPSPAFGSSSTNSATNTINGRITVYNNIVYFPEAYGFVYALTATNTGAAATALTGWPYQDRTSTGHTGSGCATSHQCPAVSNIYLDIGQNRLCFGDADGHIYVLPGSGTPTPLTGFPWQITSGDVISVAPLSRNGVLLVGATNAGAANGLKYKVYEIDETDGASRALTRTWYFSADVSSISYNPSAIGGSGAYTVGTSDGKLYYIKAATDPTSTHT
ncbi:MAG: hypothetical protein QOI66_4503 [Myxococcales bacterium]|nr:hypothetical protein [Myxococcales bacterium]